MSAVEGRAAAAAWPIAVLAQQSGKLRRVGVLMNRAADCSEGQVRTAAIQQRLQQVGWSDGQNLLMGVRWGAEDRYCRGCQETRTETLPPLSRSGRRALLSRASTD